MASGFHPDPGPGTRRQNFLECDPHHLVDSAHYLNNTERKNLRLASASSEQATFGALQGKQQKGGDEVVLGQRRGL